MGRITAGGFVYIQATDLDLVGRLLDGDAAARKELVERLGPIVRQRVSRVYERQAKSAAYDVNDLRQDVFMLLLERPQRTLGLWDPSRGLTLERFVGLVAQRAASNILRSGRKSGWAEQLGGTLELPYEANVQTPESRIAAKEELELILARLRARLSPRGIALMEALFESPEAIERVRHEFRMSPAAVHSFRSRLRMLWRVEADDVNTVTSGHMAADRI